MKIKDLMSILESHDPELEIQITSDVHLDMYPYDIDFVSVNPKYVMDRDGNRIKFETEEQVLLLELVQ